MWEMEKEQETKILDLTLSQSRVTKSQQDWSDLAQMHTLSKT